MAYVHPEERFNALAGLTLELSPYRPWCGGCTAESLAAAPLYALFGATVLVWKSVPATLHVAAAAAGAAYAWKRSPWAAVAWLGLVLGAPEAWRQLALTGWGNHADSLVFPLLAGALIRWGRPYLAGPVIGLGLWFCSTTALALPALLWMDRRWLATLLVGMLPMLFNDWAPRGDALQLATLGDWLDWLAGHFATGAWWSETYSPLSSVWWLALAVLTGHARDRLSGVTALTFLGVTLVFAGLWAENQPSWSLRAFELRYRVFLVTALMLGASLSRYRAAVLPIVLVGVGLRVTSWSHPTPALGLRVDAELPELDDCAQQGLGWVEGITGWGSRPPDDLPYAPSCPTYERGAAWGWALHVGCDDFPGDPTALETACSSMRVR